MVADLVVLNQERYRESGAELLMGEARFVAPNTVQVGQQSGEVRLIEERGFL